jgi:hypothetical protein
LRRWAVLVLVVAILHPTVPGAQAQKQQDTDEQDTEQHKRIWGFIPNYRTSPTLQNYTPLTPREKWKMTGDDALDRGTFLTAAGLAGEAQWKNTTPEFGHPRTRATSRHRPRTS